MISNESSSCHSFAHFFLDPGNFQIFPPPLFYDNFCQGFFVCSLADFWSKGSDVANIRDIWLMNHFSWVEAMNYTTKFYLSK